MASIKEVLTEDGGRYFDIRVSNGRGGSMVRRRFVPEAGWSKKTVEKKLNSFVTDLERDVKKGVIVSRTVAKEKRLAEEQRKAEEEAKIITVQQYAERVFMPALTLRASENARASFQGQLDKHILPEIGAVKMQEVSSAQVSAVLLKAQEAGLKYGSVCKVYQVMHQMFKKAYLDDAIDKNPMDRVERPRPTKAEGKDQTIAAYNADELRHIIECLENEPIKWRAYVRLLIDTGCRRGEAAGLQWEDVDFDSCTVAIKRSLNYTVQKGVYSEPPKNGKTRVLYVDAEIMNMLKELRDSRKIIALGKGWVFTQDDSTDPIFPQSPTRYFQKFGEKYGIADFHPHKLRHSYASVAITNGADVASVSENLGHSDKAVTLKMYTHADEEARKRASETMRNALRAAANGK